MWQIEYSLYSAHTNVFNYNNMYIVIEIQPVVGMGILCYCIMNNAATDVIVS